MAGHFNKHMVDAIRINRARRPGYIAQAGNSAKWLSHWMVGLERLLIPLTLYFDKKAQPFNEAGISIVENDFIDMEFIKDASIPPLYKGIASSETFKILVTSLKAIRKDGMQALKNNDYMAICEQTAESLSLIEQLEHDSQSHFAMSKHMLESIGYAALHAPIYLEQSEGKTEKLGKQLIAVHLLMADGVGVVLTDKLGQRCHSKGAGILINDVPDIPFLDEFNTLSS